MTTSARTVWFHRQYERLTGGHVKHAHYYGHVAQLPGHSRRIVFGAKPESNRLARERATLWPTAPGERVDRWCPGSRDILFLAGTDWRYFNRAGLSDAVPRINLIQHVRHAHAGTELHGYLGQRAVRICVSEEVAQAIRVTGRVNGPVYAIPNGTECQASPVDCRGAIGFDERPEGVVVVGYKRPDLAAALSSRLDDAGLAHLTLDSFTSRDAFLGLLERTRVAVCLPRTEEGFYLPALEAMAKGCTVVTLDCVGNRGFCRHEHNCLVAEDDAASLARTTMRAAGMVPTDRRRLHANAADTVRAHSLQAERQRFHALLLDIDRMWADAPRSALTAPRSAKPETSPRLVDFMIVGAQKSGTSALAHFLAQHPAVAMASREGHVFDSPDYRSDWTPEEIDARYARRIARQPATVVCGESTPIYLFLPGVAAELRRYNPALKVIVILRDPVERALSHYAMERGRGDEQRPLWFALLAERWRLRRCPDPLIPRSAVRRHSYRSRGLYSGQLRNLFEAFPRHQVLVLRSDDLQRRHDETLRNVFAFLGVSVSVRVSPETVFKGTDIGGKHAIVRWLLGLSYAMENRRLRAVTRVGGDART
ncbi:MAG: glycosyltransferase [Gammaproteobacteria bacterium]|nr:glycosyltransferase [Gammaproteobacteria bacterium]MYF29512.1 glycosyltransferase [Gammaproteobacteria bacterium]MYK46951.1 glycosyltransferase [Gammaproteobacteria bacterium]